MELLIYGAIVLTVLLVHNLRLQLRISAQTDALTVMAEENAKLWLFTTDILLEQNICEIPMDCNNKESRKQLALNSMKDIAPITHDLFRLRNK